MFTQTQVMDFLKYNNGLYIILSNLLFVKCYAPPSCLFLNNIFPKHMKPTIENITLP